MTVRVRSKRSDYQDGRDVVIVVEHDDGSRSVADPLTMRRIEPDKLIQQPTFSAHDGEDFLQAALDHAWEIGLRPKGFSDTTQQVAALKDHLSDMRALVFKRDPDTRT